MQPPETSVQKLLDDLPDKKYFTIGEVSKLCELKTHVLRYWEQVFPQLVPSKRQGRRYYQRKDLELVLEIKSLLYEQGFTISGAKAQLEQKDLHVLTDSNIEHEQGHNAPVLDNGGGSVDDHLVQKLLQMREALKAFQSYFQQRY